MVADHSTGVESDIPLFIIIINLCVSYVSFAYQCQLSFYYDYQSKQIEIVI